MNRGPLLRPFRLHRIWSEFITPVYPVVTSVTPAVGGAEGGTVITDLAGTGFQAGAQVRFGGVGGVGGTLATNVVVVSPIKITCKTPPGPVGLADVVVTNPDTTESGASGFGKFTYVPPVHILAEDGRRLMTESGDLLITETP